MAADPTKLTPASNQQNDSLPRLFLAESVDDIADVDAADYWGECKRLRVGDTIICSCADGNVILTVDAIDHDAETSTVTAIGSGGTGGQVWVGPVACTDLQTAGTVGTFVAPIAGTITKWKWITDTVTDTNDAILNLDIGGTNATGSITVDKDDSVNQIEEANVTADGAVTAGALVLIESDGGPATTGAGRAWVLIQP